MATQSDLPLVGRSGELALALALSPDPGPAERRAAAALRTRLHPRDHDGAAGFAAVLDDVRAAAEAAEEPEG